MRAIETGPPPRFLYKYRSVSQWTKRIFTEREIYFAAPSEFNDPFDSRAYYTLEPTNRELETAVAEMTRRSGKQMAGRMVLGLFDPDLRPDLEAYIQEFNESLSARIGICCLTERRDDILMWSHYADFHRGICIELDITKFQAQYRTKIYRVHYDADLPRCCFFSVEDKGLPIILTKAKQWEYEREWRALKSGQGPVKLPCEAISGVILGCSTSPADERELLSWVQRKHPRPRVYRAIRKPDAYGLDIKPEPN